MCIFAEDGIPASAMHIVHGLVLTGGTSSRMGADKATIDFDGLTLAARVARALAPVARPVLAVGHDAGTGLEAIDDPKDGPLAALVAGADALAARNADGPIVLVACDLPFVTSRVLTEVIVGLGEAAAAVPVVGGRDQPLAACYGPRALSVARRLVAEGERSMRALLEQIDVARLTVADAGDLADVDTPADLNDARRRVEHP